jgi:hypothetical protein
MARVKVHAEHMLYRISGLPIAIRVLIGGSAVGGAAEVIRKAFADRYWHPVDFSEWLELLSTFVLWPLIVVLAIIWFTAVNGAVIRRREHKAILAQMAEQAWLYFSTGMLAPWYYIFSLHRERTASRAMTFLQRSETKGGIYKLLCPPNASSLANKKDFADRCLSWGVPCVPYLLHLDGGEGNQPSSLPDCDLFVKPVKGRGGRGAERWDRVAPFIFSDARGERISALPLLERLIERARYEPLLVQPRMRVHRDLADVTTGALSTIRIVTCLDERRRPVLVGAVFRMAIGKNVTVDNLHAGGIAAAVDLKSGDLSDASNLGADAHLGWLSHHPDTGAPIKGRRLPYWRQARALALMAHAAFSDRVVIGWDVAILDGGPVIVEGNGSPDMDIMQRFSGVGICEQRFGHLLAHHLHERGASPRRPS